ncbi:hypothetical protein DMUE_1501 [Dictyocoela muelleri]|nr:hypothetical protein DMUE_1501 [Dictyocoela muelleri]
MFFHFSRIVIRYLNQNGLIINYKSDLNFRKFVKYLIFLAYVPENSVFEEFEKICKLSNQSLEYQKVIDFFNSNFILNVFKKPNKNVTFWSANSRIIKNIPTTTNACEAYHRHLNSKISRKNKKLVKIIDIFKKEEQRLKIVMSNLKNGKLSNNSKNDKRIKI